jgi:hypothetical protein
MSTFPVTLSAPFVPDAEVFRLRHERQIVETQLTSLLKRLAELDGEYHAAISAADPAQIYNPELVDADSIAFLM